VIPANLAQVITQGRYYRSTIERLKKWRDDQPVSRGEFEIASEKECLGLVGREFEKFSAPGNCVVVSAPVEANPGEPVVVIVARKL